MGDNKNIYIVNKIYNLNGYIIYILIINLLIYQYVLFIINKY